MATVNWTVSLVSCRVCIPPCIHLDGYLQSWASQFYISVIDSVGNAWSNGPLHSGEGTSASCLLVSNNQYGIINLTIRDTNTLCRVPAPKKPFPITLVSSIGSGVGGLLLGAAISFTFLMYRSRRKESTDDFITMGKSGGPGDLGQGLSIGHTNYRAVPSSPSHVPMGSGSHELQYRIEPFVFPTTTEEGGLSSGRTHVPSSNGPRSEPDSNVGSTQNSSQPQQVYVVHHDSGHAPVTVYGPDGTQVVELPPTYIEGSSPIEQRRQPGLTPRKGGSQLGSSASAGPPPSPG
jgi:hypothetical protein